MSRRTPQPPRAWQRMLSGRRLDLLDPSPIDIELEDIAHGLARVARWNGQTHGEYIFSVAQHSLLVESVAQDMAGELTRPSGSASLLHDAPEYVIGDMISPFKAVIGDVYKEVEARLLAAIRLHFGLPAKPAPRDRVTDQTRRRRSSLSRSRSPRRLCARRGRALFSDSRAISAPAATRCCSRCPSKPRRRLSMSGWNHCRKPELPSGADEKKARIAPGLSCLVSKWLRSGSSCRPVRYGRYSRNAQCSRCPQNPPGRPSRSRCCDRDRNTGTRP